MPKDDTTHGGIVTRTRGYTAELMDQVGWFNLGSGGDITTAPNPPVGQTQRTQPERVPL